MFVVSGTSVPGIAESTDGVGDTYVQVSSSVKFRGKTDLIIHKGKLLGKVARLTFSSPIAVSFSFVSSESQLFVGFKNLPNNR